MTLHVRRYNKRFLIYQSVRGDSIFLKNLNMQYRDNWGRTLLAVTLLAPSTDIFTFLNKYILVNDLIGPQKRI